MTPLRFAALSGAVLALAGCNGHDGGGGDGSTPEAMTLTQVVMDEIATGTSDTATPIVVNDLSLSGADTNETDSPLPI